MDLPTYLKNPDSLEMAEENYHEELNQTLRQNLGPNGFAISNITATDLTTTPILDPNDNTFTTVQDLMPVGTIWFDTTNAVWVGKESAGPTVLKKFDVSPYP